MTGLRSYDITELVSFVEQQPNGSLTVEPRCNGCSGVCALRKGHQGECTDRNGWPARWSDPTYLGDGPWGA